MEGRGHREVGADIGLVELENLLDSAAETQRKLLPGQSGAPPHQAVLTAQTLTASLAAKGGMASRRLRLCCLLVCRRGGAVRLPLFAFASFGNPWRCELRASALASHSYIASANSANSLATTCLPSDLSTLPDIWPHSHSRGSIYTHHYAEVLEHHPRT
jgi:hypothetical protein